MRKAAREIILTLIISALSFCVISCSGEGGKEYGDKTDISLIFSSDLRGKIRSCGCSVKDMGGLGRMASYVKEVRSSGGNTVYITGGDNFSSDFSFSREMAELVMDSYELMGLDIYTPGEYEFIFGLDYLREISSAYSFDIVIANLLDRAGGELIFEPAYVVREMDTGLKIAVTGVLDETIVFPGYVDQSGFVLEPAAEALERIIPGMREEADLLFLVCHMEKQRAEELLGRVKDFDVAILAHNKPKMDRLMRVGETVLLGAGGQGKYMGRLNYLIGRGGEMEQASVKLVPLTDDLAIDPGVRQLFEGYGIELTDKAEQKKNKSYR
ncbi:MAG: hypothetical protein GF417_00525 [Candidatus Latescibacteria bacterium]|nr:hypothetical protein [bacterium]MBD3422911.1 hypothetical protein [Candidatus Latescibacterota bacterium]